MKSKKKTPKVNQSTNNQDEQNIYNQEESAIYDPVPRSQTTCCKCCVKKEDLSKSYYINKWRTYLEKEITSKSIEDPFKILTNLWAHKDVIQDLEKIRLNPNLLEPSQIRNDLEFYIPQICTFLIFGLRDTVEEFLAFMCKACYASFFFAHRVIWFLRSLLDTDITNEEENIK